MENTRIQQLLDFLREAPQDNFLNYALAMEYVGQGNDAAARDLLETLHKRAPDYSATYYHLGKIYQRLDMRDEAEAIYQAGIVLTRNKREQHALAELMNAFNELMDELIEQLGHFTCNHIYLAHALLIGIAILNL